jgi:enoyl reductase-like protein
VLKVTEMYFCLLGRIEIKWIIEKIIMAIIFKCWVMVLQVGGGVGGGHNTWRDFKFNLDFNLDIIEKYWFCRKSV